MDETPKKTMADWVPPKKEMAKITCLKSGEGYVPDRAIPQVGVAVSHPQIGFRCAVGDFSTNLVTKVTVLSPFSYEFETKSGSKYRWEYLVNGLDRASMKAIENEEIDG